MTEITGELCTGGQFVGNPGTMDTLPVEPMGIGTKADDGSGRRVGLGAVGTIDIAADTFLAGNEGVPAEVGNLYLLLAFENATYRTEDMPGGSIEG